MSTIRFVYSRRDFGNSTSIQADNMKPGHACMRAFCDLPDACDPRSAAAALREFAKALDAMADANHARENHPDGASES